MTANDETLFAVLPKNDPAGPVWKEMFGGMRVPVTQENPVPALFTDGERLCWFVDFEAIGPAGVSKMVEVNKLHDVEPKIFEMIAAGIYPIPASLVTLVRSRRGLWRKAGRKTL